MSDPVFSLDASRGFTGWLAQIGGSLAFSTYQAGKLFFLGLKADGSLAVFERSFPRVMGIGVAPGGGHFYLATQVQLYRFDDLIGGGPAPGGNDALFAPHVAWITGDLDIHDVTVGEGGGPVFVNTLFNCLATVAEGHSFRPLWRPAFIDALVAEDRCHLNGLAADAAGRPAFVTLVGRSNVTDGWRDLRVGGGMVIEVATGEVVATGLTMPHSPRLHRGRLWILNSGTGEFGWIEPGDGRFTPVAFCPGYARGMAFAGRYAVIGLSRPRHARTFQGLPLDAALERQGAVARTGLIVVDLETGTTTDWVRIEGVVEELYDVAFLPGRRNPAAVGLKGEDIRRVISVAPGFGGGSDAVRG